MINRKTILVTAAVAALMAPLHVMAQRGGRGGRGFGPDGGFGPGGGGVVDQFGIESVKTEIKASDEEWKVIAPLLRDVMSAQQAVDVALDPSGAADPSGFGGPGGFGGRGGRGGPGGSNDVFSGPDDRGSFGGGPGGGRGGRGGRGGFGPGGPDDAGGPGAPGGFGGPGGPGGFGPPDQQGNNNDNFGGPRGGRGGRGGFGPDGAPGGFDPQGGPGGFGGAGGRGGRGGRGGFGGPGGPGGGVTSSAVYRALQELQTAMDDKNTTPDQLQEKVAAVRAARELAKQKLATAQAELLKVLTTDQAAILVANGYLD
ncbi:MAG TPA: hypothetical protein VHM90_07225 [Phycisphaerae bacterium]|nr:hypothetical protein [Phycisphaerae bacterium]